MMFNPRNDSNPAPTPVRRRAFTPPKERARPRLTGVEWPPEDWRSRVPPAAVRAFIAVGFASLPAYVDRFGNATLPLACVSLAVFSALVAYLLQRSEAEVSWSIPAADAISLLLVIPLMAVASDILLADSFLGGGTNRFLAAAIGVLCAAGAAGIAASWGSPSVSSLAFLGGCLPIAAGFVGVQRFSADAFADGMSLAWMIAALATMADGLLRPNVRAMLPTGVAAAFLVLMVVMSRGQDEVGIPESSVLVALAASAVAAGATLVVPSIAQRFERARRSGT